MKIKNQKLLNDLLTQHGQGTSQNAVKTVWKIKGLDRRMGRYSGSSAQINSLIKNLKNNPIGTDTSWVDKQLKEMGLYGQYQQVKAGMGTQPIQPAPQVSSQLSPTAQVPEGLAQQAKMAIQKGQETIMQTQEFLKGRGIKPATSATFPMTKPTITQPTIKPTITQPTITKETAPTISETKETTAQSILANIPDVPSAESIMEQVIGSQEFKLAQERLGLSATAAEASTEAVKEAMDTKYASDKKALENSLLESGIESSTLATSQIRALGEALATSKLGADRKLAVALMDANFDLKEMVYGAAADVVKDAQAGRKDAITQLNKAGMAVMPDGTLTSTLEAQREKRIAEEAKKPKEYMLPTSYREWELAGKQKSYSQFLIDKQGGIGGYTDSELRRLREAGINSDNIDEADNFLYGDVLPDNKIKETIELFEAQIAETVAGGDYDDDEIDTVNERTLTKIRTILLENGKNPDTYANGKYKRPEEGGFWKMVGVGLKDIIDRF